MRNRVARILGLAAGPDAATGFAELGMDSLMAVELRRQLEQDCGCGLPATVAFEYPTVERLAGYLLNEVLGLVTVPLTTAQGADAQRPADSEDAIAVVGLACRFPGAATPEAFWQLLLAGEDMVRPISRSRWNVEEYYDPRRSLPGKTYVREAALLDDVAAFDPLFFGIAPREAAGSGSAASAAAGSELGSAGACRAGAGSLVGSQTGVFVGIGASDYGGIDELQDAADAGYLCRHKQRAQCRGRPAGLHVGATGADDGRRHGVFLVAGCVAPGVPEPAHGECDLALAGGVNLMLSP